MVQSYIVRVYRRNPIDKASVSGILEDIETGQEKPFQSLSELQSILLQSIDKDHSLGVAI